jgi:hypothetical protein
MSHTPGGKMITAARLERRAIEIMNACGGEPSRAQLAHPTPTVRAAREAYHVGWYLMFARTHLSFLSSRHGAGVESLKWCYVAYRSNRISARRCIHLAAEHLVKAEKLFAELKEVV